MTRVEVTKESRINYTIPPFNILIIMADDFDAAATWLSSNPSAATLPNDTKLEVYSPTL